MLEYKYKCIYCNEIYGNISRPGKPRKDFHAECRDKRPINIDLDALIVSLKKMNRNFFRRAKYRDKKILEYKCSQSVL
jgi:hypothetical protein